MELQINRVRINRSRPVFITIRKQSLRRLCHSVHRSGDSRPIPKGRLRGLARGYPGLYPVGRVRGLAGQGIRAQASEGSPGPVGGRWIPACTEADLPKQTATGGDGTHPSVMYSCISLILHGFMNKI